MKIYISRSEKVSNKVILSARNYIIDYFESIGIAVDIDYNDLDNDSMDSKSVIKADIIFFIKDRWNNCEINTNQFSIAEYCQQHDYKPLFALYFRTGVSDWNIYSIDKVIKSEYCDDGYDANLETTANITDSFTRRDDISKLRSRYLDTIKVDREKKSPVDTHVTDSIEYLRTKLGVFEPTRFHTNAKSYTIGTDKNKDNEELDEFPMPLFVR